MPKPKKPVRPPTPEFRRTALIRTANNAVAAEPVSVPPSRAGRVLIAGHFAPEVQTALKIAAAEQRTTVQALLAEGINAVFARLGKPQIAGISAERPKNWEA